MRSVTTSVAGLLLLAILFSIVAVEAQNGGSVQVTYTSSDENFPNPERGFYRQRSPLWLGLEQVPLDAAELRSFRDRDAISVLRGYYVIDEFRAGPISAAALQLLASDLAVVRATGLKIVLRFAYSFPCVGSLEPCGPATFGITDAPLTRVLGHIDQLAPILAANVDVIAFMEMGFIGAWGEWHSSSNGLVGSDRRVNASSAAIAQRVLTVLPSTRMAALRNPFHKQALLGPTPLTAAQAFSGALAARVGAHNDCFLANAHDAGTYDTPYPPFGPQTEFFKQYLSLDNRYVPQGGETCSFEGEAQTYIPCGNAMTDLARMHWSLMNVEYQPQVLDLWRQQGCFNDIARRLGYRLRLVQADFASRGAAGGLLPIQLVIANDGFASLYNPRLVELVLRHTTTRREHLLPVNVEPRFWGGGETHSVSVAVPVPASVEPGSYELLLNLPDPEATLRGRPDYSVRLANANLWEAATGYNQLRASVEIGAGVGLSTTVMRPAVLSGGSVTLQWNAIPDALDYLLEAGSAAGLANLYNGSAGRVTSLTASIAAGVYYVRVRVQSALGIGPASNEVSFSTGGAACVAPPVAPQGLTGAVVNGVATVSWTPVAGATTYFLQAGPTPGTSTFFNGSVGSSLSVAAPVAAGFRAFVRAFATNACGQSSPSGEVLIQ